MRMTAYARRMPYYSPITRINTMKPMTINVQITKCPKQYESIRLGMECSLDANETAESAIKAATDELTRIYGEMIAPQNEARQVTESDTETVKEPKRERLEFGDKRLQQIINRIEKNPKDKEYIIERTLKYFEPSEQVMKVLNLAQKIA